MVIKNAVLITGASQRIGFYLAESFLKEGLYPVVFTYRTFRPGVQALIDQGATGIQVDFTVNKSLYDFLEILPKKIFSLRAVVHNASLWIKEDRLKDFSCHYQEMFQVHMIAPYLVNKACYPLLKKASHHIKDIIAISDAKTKQGDDSQIAYLATKAGLESMTKSFAQAFSPDVKVNAILPGLVIFNEDDSENYKAKRLAEMAISIEPGADIIWQSVQHLMSLPNTTGQAISLGS